MPDQPETPPDALLMQALFGFMATRCVTAAAELGVADALRNGPLYYTDLAKAVEADQRALHRVMRLLVSLGIFAESEPGTYELTPVSDLLRSDHPHSMRDMAVMLTSDSHWLPWGRFSETLMSGTSGPWHAFGTDIFTWFQDSANLQQWQMFNAAMTSFSLSTSQAVIQSYDFTPYARIVDIGGGHGHFLKTALSVAPEAHGVLFDLPGVINDLDPGEIGDRIEPVGGDFFEAVPAGGDCYTMKHIIHDWSDDHCRTLLSNIAEVMNPDGTVAIIETVMPETDEAHPAKFMDVNMLAMTEGGTERTESEFVELLEAAGLRLQAIHPTPSPVFLIEARLA
jgi:hypothetical protein